jgi:hypothetical protein
LSELQERCLKWNADFEEDCVLRRTPAAAPQVLLWGDWEQERRRQGGYFIPDLWEMEEAVKL